tara:strand:- start:71 stop:766 length:696 start_codon:yes stop_codon:yes gene_type:complete
MLAAVIAITFVSTNSFAGSFGVGVAGHMASISADGTETPGGTEAGTENSVKSATAGNSVGFGSVFAEYNFGEEERFTLGVDYIPGTADVNSKTLSRTNVTTSAAETNQQDGDRSANAELSSHYTYYGEFVVGGGLFVKAGYAQVDVKTKDTATGGTAGTYGDVTLDAMTYGIGHKGSFGERGFYKIEGYVTDYDTFNATGTGSSENGTSTQNTVTANLDVVGAALRVGMKF